MLNIVYGEERGMWCPSTVARDNWVRLVEAVVKKEQIWQLCHQQSISTISSHDSTQPSLSYSVPPLPFKNPSLSRGKLFPGWFGRRKYVDKDLVDIPEDIAIHLGQLQRFQIQELQVATESFNSRNKLGKGGYGNVYKGRLADGTLIAVKRRREMIAFQTEVEVMSSVAVHRNLLRPRGFCMSTMGCFLVYPYLPNGSVLSCLRERRESEAPLSWTIRKRIALGVARGVAHLHEELGDFKIIHRNISAEKIFLDEDFEAVVGDFSLAVLVEQNDTYVGNTGRGTTGLISPEYVATGGVSEKSDVYGYGVFLLELISERKAWTLAQLAKDEDLMLLDWIHRLYKGKKWEKIVGANNYIEDAVMKQLLQIALLCTEINPKKRPKMSEVVSMIEDSDCSSPRMVEP